MKTTENIDVNGQTAPALRTAGRVAVVTALAAIIFLAVWPTTSAEVAQSGSSSPKIGFGSSSLAGDIEQNDRAKEGDRLARDYSDWLSAAHRRAGVIAQAQPLPAQF